MNKCRWILWVLLALTDAAHARELRVCADPNNLPFSNRSEQGFENKIIALLAADLGAQVRYTWWAQRRGNIRNTLNAGLCDLIPGVASSLEMLATTRPYYRSQYVFISRAKRQLNISSLDDPRLRELTIGVQLIGDDGSNTPPAHALARRGIVQNVRGYMVYGDYADAEPNAQIVKALERGDIDVAAVWGPVAGYFAKRDSNKFTTVPITPWLDGPQWPMVFDISMGVRKGEATFKREIDAALERNRAAVQKILRDYGVPQPQSAPLSMR
jgi:quinoprotein dehydrogenase-associated probable ABC transporter substrate-binding protein